MKGAPRPGRPRRPHRRLPRALGVGLSGAAGDLPGWRQIPLDDFTQDVASWGDCDFCPHLLRASGAVPLEWFAFPSSYMDTREKLNGDGGFYQPSDMYMSGGQLHLPLSRANGTSRSQAPVPKVTDGRTYGRFSLRALSTRRPTSRSRG